MLRFGEDMCFDESPQRFPGPFADKFIIDGPGFPFQVCPLSKREAIVEQPSRIYLPNNDSEEENKERCPVSGSQGFKYQVGLPLHAGQTYTVYLPKIF